jgi:hypothetical protein
MATERPASNAEVELAVEESTLARLERLGNGQRKIFEAVQRDRRRWSVVAFGVIAVIIIVVLVGGITFNRQGDAIDQINRTRTQSRVSLCLQANDTAHKINAGNDAKAAIRDSAVEIQAELDSLLGPIVNPATPPSTPAQAASLADFKARYEASRQKVEDKLAFANEKIAEAHVDDRDCSPDAVNEQFDATTTTNPGG